MALLFATRSFMRTQKTVESEKLQRWPWDGIDPRAERPSDVRRRTPGIRDIPIFRIKPRGLVGDDQTCLTNRILERPLVVDRHVDLGDRLARGHAGEELLRHLGQQRAREDVVDVAGAALDLRAAAGDGVDQVVAVGELRPCGSPSSAGRSGRAAAG